MLRHSCGFALANMGIDTRLIQDYLGHRNIRHTVWYTASNAGRFYGIWDSARDKKGELFYNPSLRRRLRRRNPSVRSKIIFSANLYPIVIIKIETVTHITTLQNN
jgi:hypothetical protein